MNLYSIRFYFPQGSKYGDFFPSSFTVKEMRSQKKYHILYINKYLNEMELRNQSAPQYNKN